MRRVRGVRRAGLRARYEAHKAALRRRQQDSEIVNKVWATIEHDEEERHQGAA
jgi:hypothetical protein